MLLASCAGSGTSSPDSVSLWGVTGTFVKFQDKIISDFTRSHPDIKVRVNEVPSQGTGDATSVITAVRGGTAPDLWLLDRFSAAQYAAIGLIEPIDDLIEQYEDDKTEFLANWLGFTIGELTYQGDTYGLPMDTDARGMFVNRTMLGKAGIDADEFDWQHNGPVTMDRMAEVNEKLSKKDGGGDYTEMGFIPWYGEGWPFTWGLGLGASYYDQSKGAMTMDSASVRSIYEFYEDWAKRLGYKDADTFIATYEPTGHPPGQLAFLNNRMAFMVTVPANVSTFRDYGPKNLDYTTANLPVMKEGDDPFTWSGGFALCMPKGSKHNRAVWEFMKYYTGVKGQTTYMKPATGVPSERSVLKNPNATDKGIKYFVNAMKDSTCRPPLPVGGAWWDSLADARSSVLLGSAGPQEAVERAQARVNPMMQTYTPFKLPKDYDKVVI
jgi:multiple sugar transport system substrate-binding protein